MDWPKALPILYSTINASEQMPKALDEVARQSHARGMLLTTFNEVGFEYSEGFSNSIYNGLEDRIREFSERFFEIEQAAWKRVLAAPFGKPVLDFDVWSEGHGVKTRDDIIWVRELLGVYRRFGYNLSPAVGWSSGVVIQFSEELDDIPEKAVPNSQNFVPHLAKIAELLRFVSTLKKKYNAVYSVLDKVNIGILVFDRKGSLVVKNAVAERSLGEGDGISLKMGRVKLSDPDRAAELDALMSKIVATSVGEDSASEASIVVERPSQKMPYTVFVSPLNDGGAEIERRFYGTLMFIFDTENPPAIDVAPLATLAGLTKAETETTRLMMEGRSDREISEIRNVSYETVRTQIKTVLTKAGVSNRLDLVRAASMITPPIS